MVYRYRKTAKLLLIATVLIASEMFGVQAQAQSSRKFLFSLPLITLGRPAITKAEFNIKDKASMALEWTFLGKGEELRESELKLNPEDSLSTQGQELGLSFSRFSQPSRMAGMFWTIGAGYRRMQADWRKNPIEDDTNEQAVDDLGKVNHQLDVAGTTMTWRFGYRYVGQDLGFAAGIYLGVKHFQNRVNDRDQKDEEANIAYSPAAHHDKLALKRRLMSSFQPGIELGWAF